MIFSNVFTAAFAACLELFSRQFLYLFPTNAQNTPSHSYTLTFLMIMRLQGGGRASGAGYVNQEYILDVNLPAVQHAYVSM